MPDFKDIYDAMRSSPMNDWVGGSDPEIVGDACVGILKRLVAINGESKVLDFGCGIGRGLTSLYKSGVHPAHLVGMDIMPPVIDFCDTHIAPKIDNINFELICGNNDHYDRFIEGIKGNSYSDLSKKYQEHFNVGYAFSVFTHVTEHDFQKLMNFVSSMLLPGGRFLFTCFELNAFSRSMVQAGQSMFPLDAEKLRNSGDIFMANDDDPLAFIAFDEALIRKMVWQAGMAITKVEYGCWMGGRIGGGLQDAIICTKLPAPLAQSDIIYTPLVERPPSGKTMRQQAVSKSILQKFRKFWS